MPDCDIMLQIVQGQPHVCSPTDGFVFALGQVGRAEVWDAGRYTCEALNQAGRSEKHFNLNIWGKGLQVA